MSNKQIEVYAQALRRQREEEKKKAETERQETKIPKSTPVSTLNFTQARDNPRKVSSENKRESSRNNQRELPTRDEIQEFSFRLRDELKVKVQAEVPHQWQDELEEIARQLDVKKLELYRYILGAFLGKVKRKDQT